MNETLEQLEIFTETYTNSNLLYFEAWYDDAMPTYDTHGDATRLLEVYLATRTTAVSRQTARTYLRICARLLGYEDEGACPWHDLRYADIVLLRDKLLEGGRQPSSVNSYISVVRGLMREARKLRLLDIDDYADIVDVPDVPEDTDRPAAGRAITRAEYERLLAACEEDDSRGLGLRDIAILTLLYTTGVRASTLLAISLSDVDLTRLTLKVSEKGGKRRTLPISDKCAAAIRRYLVRRGDWPGPLFVNASCGKPPHKLTRRPLGYHGLSDMIERRATEAGVAHFTCHDLRRTLAGDMLQAGVDIKTVADIMGHKSVAMTAQYDRRGGDAMRDAITRRDDGRNA